MQCCEVIEFFTISPHKEKFNYNINELMQTENIIDFNTAWYWVSSNITYKSDTIEWYQYDDWQSAEETLTKRTGDCEDFSILLGEFLERLDYETMMLIIEWGDGYHAILQVGALLIEPQAYGLLYTRVQVERRYTYSEYRHISVEDILRGQERSEE